MLSHKGGGRKITGLLNVFVRRMLVARGRTLTVQLRQSLMPAMLMWPGLRGQREGGAGQLLAGHGGTKEGKELTRRGVLLQIELHGAGI